jgi:hypothetical protein
MDGKPPIFSDSDNPNARARGATPDSNADIENDETIRRLNGGMPQRGGAGDRAVLITAAIALAMILLGSGVMILVRHGRIAWNTAFGRLVVSVSGGRFVRPSKEISHVRLQP